MIIDWKPSFTMLRIAKLFVESTARKRCCYEVAKRLHVSDNTARSALRTLHAKEWLEKETRPAKQVEDDDYRPEQVLYRITVFGRDAASHALAYLQMSTINSSSAQRSNV